MRLSTRIALAVGATVPVLVLATGWLLLRLVAADLHDQQDAHLRQSAAAVAKDARGLLRASAADRSARIEQARERRLFTSALDVGVRLRKRALVHLRQPVGNGDLRPLRSPGQLERPQGRPAVDDHAAPPVIDRTLVSALECDAAGLDFCEALLNGLQLGADVVAYDWP